LKGQRIIIPERMKADVLKLIHTGHQGIERSKRRARQTCYWPNMNKQIELMVKRCKVCAKYAPSKSREPLHPPPLPTRPWQKIASDLFETRNSTYIIITDYYSLWPEVYQLTNTQTSRVPLTS
jgi:hypothetical protein